MARKSIIKTEIEQAEANGFKLYKQGSGKITLTHGSKLCIAYAMCAKEHPDADVEYLVGGNKRYQSQGSDWAVVYTE